MGIIARNLDQVRTRIAAAARQSGRDPSSIKLVAVSKMKSIEDIREACEAGQYAFGENYAQELRQKADILVDLPLEWHFIGHLQRNKAKLLAHGVPWVTVDSFAAAEALDRRATQNINLLIEVNVAGELTKAGIEPKEAPELISTLQKLNHVKVRGLMCLPPYDDDPEKSRPYFRKLRELLVSTNLTELSMGMSHDFEVAIAEGATIIRVGEAIFGKRR